MRARTPFILTTVLVGALPAVALCPDAPAAVLTKASCTMPAGTELNLRVAIAANWPVDGFVADPNYPDVTASNLWSKWLYFYLNGNLPGETRFCGVALPDFSHDLGLAEEAADLAGYEPPFEANDAAGLCNAVVLYAGSAAITGVG